MAPLIGCNLISKNLPLPVKYNQSEQRRVSEKGQSPTQVQYLLFPDQICSNPNCKQWQRTETKNAPPLPMSKRRNKKTDEEKQCQKKQLDRAKKKTRINIGALNQRWRELLDL